MIAAIDRIVAPPRAADRIHRRLFERPERADRDGVGSIDTRNSTPSTGRLRQNSIRTIGRRVWPPVATSTTLQPHVDPDTDAPSAARPDRRDAGLDVRRDGLSH